jgi:hypothetical protein
MMFGTSKTLLALLGLFAGTLVSTTLAVAQEPTTVTGCISKGTGPGTFSITGEDGKAYSLTSTTVKLDPHVGHKVTVTGGLAGVETGAVKDTGMTKDTGMRADTGAAAAPGMARDTGMKHEPGMKHDTGAAGGAALNVTSMTMVSAECS